jgi:hypothetical protein
VLKLVVEKAEEPEEFAVLLLARLKPLSELAVALSTVCVVDDAKVANPH